MTSPNDQSFWRDEICSGNLHQENRCASTGQPGHISGRSTCHVLIFVNGMCDAPLYRSPCGNVPSPEQVAIQMTVWKRPPTGHAPGQDTHQELRAAPANFGDSSEIGGLRSALCRRVSNRGPPAGSSPMCSVAPGTWEIYDNPLA